MVKGESVLADATPARGTPLTAPTVQATSARRTVALGYVLALVVLFAISFGIRAIGLGGAVTEDEDQWIARSGTFARALAMGDWRRTYLTGHPGVTTMWLTTLALGIERTSTFARGAGAPDVTVEPDFLPALQRARIPFAVLQAGLGKLDLVTREEFEVQRAVLLRTREKLDELQRTVAELEARLGNAPH